MGFILVINTVSKYDLIPKHILPQLLVLTFSNGVMYQWMNSFHNGNEARVCWVEEQEKVLAWGMLINNGYANSFGSGFYTHPEYLRRGLASMIYKELKNKFGSFKTYPHDEISHSFFNKMKEKTNG